MTSKQLHFLKPGDLVRRKGKVLNHRVQGIVLYITADDQVVDAAKVGDTMYQREEMLKRWCVVKQ